jgi:hypothetical protein
LIVAVLLAPVASSQTSGVKAMFYDPAAGQPTPAAEPRQRLKPIKWAWPFPRNGFVGIHYWFEDADGRAFSEERAAAVSGSLTLNLRSNVEGFVSVWRMNGVKSTERSQLLYTRLQWEASRVHGEAEESAVRSEVQFTLDESPKTLIIVFGRSETEQANSPESARNRLQTLSTRTDPDGTRWIVRESDDATPGEIGTYVVNRRGMPLAVEIGLQRRRTAALGEIWDWQRLPRVWRWLPVAR